MRSKTPIAHPCILAALMLACTVPSIDVDAQTLNKPGPGQATPCVAKKPGECPDPLSSVIVAATKVAGGCSNNSSCGPAPGVSWPGVKFITTPDLRARLSIAIAMVIKSQKMTPEELKRGMDALQRFDADH